jgi:hypothetical protein
MDLPAIAAVFSLVVTIVVIASVFTVAARFAVRRVERLMIDRSRVLGTHRVLVGAAGTGAGLTLIAALPWIGAILPGGAAQTPLYVLGLFLGAFGAFLIASQLSFGWAALSATVVLMAAIWITWYSVYLMYVSGWHGLNVDDLSIEGDGGWALALPFYTLAAPVVGFVIAIVAQRKRVVAG